MKLHWEITTVIMIKLIALYIIWMLCFSHPVAPTLTTQSLQERWLATSSINKKQG